MKFVACQAEMNHTFFHPFQVGVWLSLVERFVRDEEVAGSNPVTPTTLYSRCCALVDQLLDSWDNTTVLLKMLFYMSKLVVLLYVRVSCYGKRSYSKMFVQLPKTIGF